jgi:citronellyl-CoA dehydrogenase
MMLFTDEHELLRKSLRSFIDREIEPHATQWEEDRIFPAHEVFKKLGNEGFLGLTKPEEYGGAGLDYSYAIVHGRGARPHHLRRRLAGDRRADRHGHPRARPLRQRRAAQASSSPPRSPATSSAASASARSAAGSDVASIKTTARKDGDDYIINGGKMWITNGIQADWMCCLANTSDDKAHKNKSLIIVPMNTKGVERARKLHKLGMWASDTAQIFFDDVRVPQRYRIGAEGMGFMLQMMQFQEERLWGAANSVTAMDMPRSTPPSNTPATARPSASPILDNQVVHFRMAELPPSSRPCAPSSTAPPSCSSPART